MVALLKIFVSWMTTFVVEHSEHSGGDKESAQNTRGAANLEAVLKSFVYSFLSRIEMLFLYCLAIFDQFKDVP